MFPALALLGLLVPSFGYSEPRFPVKKFGQTSDVRSRHEEKKRTLKAQLVDVKVKNEPDDIHAVVGLRVRFLLRNDEESTSFIIPEAVNIVGIRLARSQDDARSGPYLIERLTLPSFPEPRLLKITDHTSAQVNAVLPGAQWEWETDIPLKLSRRRSASIYPPEVGLDDLQKLDAFWCQFEIAFWPHTMKEEGEQLQKEWKEHGLLLRETLTSTLIRLSLKP